MLFLLVVTVVAVFVAVGAVQNGQAVTVSFFIWRFQAPLAVVILGATTAGMLIGALVTWTQALRRRRRAPATRPPSSAAPRAALGGLTGR